MSWRMHYIMDRKYDLIFSVDGATEEEAKANAEAELKSDGLADRVTLFQADKGA